MQAKNAPVAEVHMQSQILSGNYKGVKLNQISSSNLGFVSDYRPNLGEQSIAEQSQKNLFDPTSSIQGPNHNQSIISHEFHPAIDVSKLQNHDLSTLNRDHTVSSYAIMLHPMQMDPSKPI